MMALHSPFSAMEGTNGNYEPMHGGRLGRSHGTFGSGLTGTFSESPVEPRTPDPDLQAYPCLNGLEQVLMELESVDRICAAMIKKFQAPDGPGTSQSDVSQCSTENTAMKNPSIATGSIEKKREKFIPPANIIDLTSEDSCDSGISTRPDQEPMEEDAGQVLSPLATSVATGITGICSPPVSPPSLKRQHPDSAETQGGSPAVNGPPEIITILSDSDDDEDDDDEKRRRWEHSENDKAVEIKKAENEDELADVWAVMANACREAGHDQVPTPVVEKLKAPASAKRLKVNKGDDVSHNVGYEYQPIQYIEAVNEPMQVETFLERPKRGRGRPRKEPGPSQVRMEIDKTDHQNGKPGKPGKRDGIGEVQRDKKGKGKARDGEELKEDEFDEEDEERAKAEDPDLAEELRKVNAKLNGDKVEYEPYVRKSYQEEEDELDEVFNELDTVVATTAGPALDTTKTNPEEEPPCSHRNFDFDEDVGYYCEDCGTVGIEMPTADAGNKTCAHKNWDFTEEAGVFCADCGKVRQHIESVYHADVQSDSLGHFILRDLVDVVTRSPPNTILVAQLAKGARKQTQKVQEQVDQVSQVQLTLEGYSGKEDFRGADLELHPFFQDRLHPHQKKGFKFLTENLLGGRQRSQDSIGCVLAHAPGTGKTCLVISFIQSFLSRFSEGKPLILAPKIMLQSWENEFENWKVQEVPIYRIGGSARDTPPVDVGGYEDDEDEEEAREARLAPHVKTPLKEGRARKLREWQKGRGVLLMSYKLFANLVTNGLGDHVLPESLDYQMSKVLLESTNLVVLDEGHLARNGNTQITRALQAMETKRRVLLSGTLFQNNFKELYTLLKLCRDDFMLSSPLYGKRILEIDASSNGSKYSNRSSEKMKKEFMQIEEKIFTEEIGERLEKFVKSGETRTDEIESVVMKLQSLTASFVDWYPGEILKSLPGLIEYSIHLNLTEDQKTAVDRLPNSDQVRHHMSRQYMLLAACMHPSLVHHAEEAGLPFSQRSSSSLKKEAHKGVKITFILRLMASCKLAGEKLLIFCSTLDPLTYIEGLFSEVWEWSQGKQILRLDGSMLDSDRQRIIQMFNDKDSPSQVLLASTRACKEGITLVGASRVVILDNLDNPSVVRQAVSRAFRIGQKKKVYVYRLVTTHKSEEDIFRRSVSKERLSQVLLDPVSTMSKFGNFLQEQRASDIEDKLLQRLILTDREHGQINVVNRYNAAG